MNAIVDPLYEEKPTSRLYHYTSLDAIQSIIKERGVWATDIHYFNDSAELGHTAGLLCNEIRRRLTDGTKNRTILNQLLQWVGERITSGHTLFVASLTPNGNLLSQWRGYCSYGKGLSLGFSAAHVIKCAAEQSYNLGQCVYDSSRQREIVKKIIDTVETLALSEGAAPPSKAHPAQSYHPVFSKCEDSVLRIAALFKNSAFREEAEWRAVSPVVADYVHTNIEYRPGRSTLIPYKLFSLSRTDQAKLELEHVIIGPTPQMNLSMNSLGQLFSRNGISPMIENSQLPYRET
ncbi:MAG: DUF2971 domain-containing protein [Nitrospira sp.]|nr:DUF2971 domain-containing protein [Nitrospira sp.]